MNTEAAHEQRAAWTGCVSGDCHELRRTLTPQHQRGVSCPGAHHGSIVSSLAMLLTPSPFGDFVWKHDMSHCHISCAPDLGAPGHVQRAQPAPSQFCNVAVLPDVAAPSRGAVKRSAKAALTRTTNHHPKRQRAARLVADYRTMLAPTRLQPCGLAQRRQVGSILVRVVVTATASPAMRGSAAGCAGTE
jgi:hypothetical protein